MRYLIPFLFISLAGCVGADYLPPEACDYRPTSMFTVSYVTEAQARAICAGAPACTWGGRLVIIPDTGYSNYWTEIMTRHEYGHVNCPDWIHQ